MNRHSLIRSALTAALVASVVTALTPTGANASGTATADLAPAAVTAPAATALAAPDISLANMQAHLQNFQNIATSNGGNRRSTSPGYTASVNYVYDKLVAAGYSVVKQTCASGCTSGAGPNVIADWPGGDTNSVIMLGAHLDSVSAGPGSNDNASGSSMLLEVALTLAAQNPTLTKHVRFGWWTDEEQGLNGSEYYASSLGSTNRAKIAGYLNFDMVASTNGGYFINRITSTIGQTVKAYYDSIGVQTEENVEGAGRSDDASFNTYGIQTSGIAAGASARKTTAQATKWGGTANAAYDPCYHRACDTYPSNISTTHLNRAGDGAAYALWALAVGTPTGNNFSVAVSPGSGSVTAGGSTNATVSTATTSGSAQTVNLTASGLPSGATASFSPSSVTSGASSALTISTSASTPLGTYPVTITGTGTSATRTTTYTLTVTGTGGCGSPGQKLANAGFESGVTGWTASSGVIAQHGSSQPARTGTWAAWLDGYGSTHTDTLAQSVTLPTGCSSYSLSFWLHIDTAETTTSVQYDKLTVQVLNSSGTVLGTLATYSNLNKAAGYSQKTFNLAAYAGQSIQLKFTGTEDSSLQTSFVIDDTALNIG